MRTARQKAAWKKAAAVLLMTALLTGMLPHAPARADEWELPCGMEEHIHTEECYRTGDPPQIEVICEPEVHMHSDACFGAEGELCCGMSDALVHIHQDLCSDGETLICPLEERTEHLHGPECFADGVLVCSDPSGLHFHTENCRDEEGKYLCGLLQPAVHIHDESCRQFTESLSDVPLCGFMAHEHTEECFGEELLSAISPLAAGGYTLSLSALGVYSGYKGGIISYKSTGSSPRPGMNCSFTDLAVHRLTGSGKNITAFCVEPWAMSVNGHSYGETNSSGWDHYPVNLRRAVAMTMYYGYPNSEIPDSAFSNGSTGYRPTVKGAVTQAIIFELVSGLRDPVSFAYTGGTRVFRDSVTEQYAYNHTGDRILITKDFQDAYDYLESRLMSANRIPSFTSRFPGGLNESTAIELRSSGNGETFTATVNDSNGVLDSFLFEQCSGNGITYSRSGNRLTITATREAVSGLDPSQTVRIPGRMVSVDPDRSCIVYGDASQSSCQDLVALTSSPGTDPIACYLNLKVRGGTIVIEKTSSDYHVGGIGFTVRSESGAELSVVTDETGLAPVANLPEGSYTVTEQIPDGYRGEGSKTVDVQTGGTTVVTFHNDPVVFHLEVTKKAKDEATILGAANLSGAVFGLYRSGTLLKEYTTDENGSFLTEDYPAGDGYTLRELSAPEGFLRSEEEFTIPAGVDELTELSNEILLTVEEERIFGGLTIEKTDAENGTAGSGAAAVAGAEYSVSWEGERPVTIGDHVYEPGDTVTTLIIDETGLASTGTYALAYGPYHLRESSAPEGYLPDEGIRAFTIEEPGMVQLFTGEGNLKEEVIRGDLRIVKSSAEDLLPMEGIVFEVRSKTTGERHLLVTGPDGTADTSAVGHTSRTNASDPALREDGTVDESLLDAQCGIWFHGTSSGTSQIRDDRGALPYDTYIVRELRTAANAEYIDPAPVEVTVDQEHAVVTLDPMINYGIPWVRTRAADTATGTQNGCVSEASSLEDTVTYYALDTNTTFTVKGEVLDAQTGEPVLRRDGSVVTAERTLNPETRQGTFVMTFDLSDTELEGRTLVCAETVYTADGTEVCSHRDMQDAAQTVYYPALSTSARNENGGKEINTESGVAVTVIDTVWYQNLRPGTEYLLEGTLMDPMTGEAYTDEEGSPMTVRKTFTAETADGSEDLVFTVPAELVRGRSAVVFETLMYGDVPVCVHASLEDRDQTVWFPKLCTRAASVEGLGYVYFEPDSMTVSFTDTVSWEGLQTDTEHVLETRLYDTAAGTLILTEEGSELWMVTPFVPETTNGELKIELTVPSAQVYGKKLVFFQTLGCGEEITAAHTDPKDADQTLQLGKPSQIFKYDASTLKGLPGAEILFSDLTTGETQLRISDENGNVIFTGIPGHRYSFTEQRAPKGYLRDNTEYFFEVKETGELEGTVSLMNVHGGTIVISKKDVITGEPVEGASITVFNSKNQPVFTQKTTADGKIYFYTEDRGDFSYRETEAPEGYVISTDTYRFHIDEDLKVTGTLRFVDVPVGTVELRKIDGNGQPVQGAEFTFYNFEGHALGSAVSNERGRVYFVTSEPGTYTFRETNAPYGYVRRTDTWTVQVGADGTVSGDLTIVNERNPSDTVVTGDLSRPGLWAAFAASALLALGAVTVILRKKGVVRHGRNHAGTRFEG